MNLISCPSLCKACSHKDLSLSQSLSQKEAWLKKNLSAYEQLFSPIRFLESKRWGYRSKVCLQAGFENEWKLGLTQREEILEIPDCPLHASFINEFVKILKGLLPSYELFPLHHLQISKAQVTLVVKTAKLPLTSFLETLYEHCPRLGIEGLWLHLNPSCGRNVFMGKNWKLLWGKERSQDEKGLWYGPASFSQLIPELHEESLLEAKSFFALKEGERLIDLYCGNGSSLRAWGQAQMLGVEIGAEAVACAQLNVPQASILRGLAKDRLPQMEDVIENEDYTLYVNPPRTGLEKELVDWLLVHPPRKMAYLSCSVGTLKRDLEILGQKLQVQKIIPYDFFPGTRHVESLVLLEKIKSRSSDRK